MQNLTFEDFVLFLRGIRVEMSSSVSALDDIDYLIELASEEVDSLALVEVAAVTELLIEKANEILDEKSITPFILLTFFEALVPENLR